jgi:hypothetical protein
VGIIYLATLRKTEALYRLRARVLCLRLRLASIVIHYNLGIRARSLFQRRK